MTLLRRMIRAFHSPDLGERRRGLDSIPGVPPPVGAEQARRLVYPEPPEDFDG